MPCPKKHTTERASVVHSPTFASAEDRMRWMVLPYFENKWRQHGLGDEDFMALRAMIMMDPKRPPVVKGTGGLRKIRFGKKGHDKLYRIGYVYFESFFIIVMMVVYSKQDMVDIPAGQRSDIKKQIVKLYKWIEAGG